VCDKYLGAHSSLGAVNPSARFRAFEGGREVAESESLDGLASKLRERGVDPRTVRIVSTTPMRQVARAGLQGKRG
jgi:hypothetical protein